MATPTHIEVPSERRGSVTLRQLSAGSGGGSLPGQIMVSFPYGVTARRATPPACELVSELESEGVCVCVRVRESGGAGICLSVSVCASAPACLFARSLLRCVHVLIDRQSPNERQKKRQN